MISAIYPGEPTHAHSHFDEVISLLLRQEKVSFDEFNGALQSVRTLTDVQRLCAFAREWNTQRVLIGFVESKLNAEREVLKPFCSHFHSHFCIGYRELRPASA